MKKFFLMGIGVFLFYSCSFDNRNPTATEYSRRLQGTWVSGCYDFNGLYRKQTMTFSHAQVRVDEEVFSDSGCSVSVMNYHFRAGFSIGTAMGQLIPSSRQYITVVLEVKAVATDPLTVSSYNSQNMCGYSDWVLNEEKDVNDRDCEAGDRKNPKVGRQYINLIKIENDYDLFIGNDRCELDGTCIVYYGQKYPRDFYSWTLRKQ